MSQQSSAGTSQITTTGDLSTMETDSAAKEVNLTLTWKKAVLAFCDATQQDYDEFLRRPSRQEIEDDIQDALKRDQKNIESQALENLGKGLLDVADVVVDAVSDVFTPVGICFKAVKLVFKLSAACRRSFSTKSLQKLLSSKCKEVMGTFAPYATGITPTVQAKIPIGIKSLLIELMTHFMAICTQCATEAQLPKPERLRKKISMYGQMVIRALAGGEASVRHRAETLNDLLSQFRTQISSNMHTSMLKLEVATEDISKQIFHQTEQIKRQASVILDDSQQARIQEHLGFNNDDPRDFWRGTYQFLQERTFPKTGEWIGSNKDIQEWTDVDKSASNIVLALEAPVSGGKTHTCFGLLRNLIDQQERSESQTSRRANVAYFFFERPGDARKISSDSKTGISLRDALAGLILQLTKSDVAFQTYVAKQCHSTGNTTYDGRNIWDYLIMGYSMAASKQTREEADEHEARDTRAGKIFFLIIDGLEVARRSQQGDDGTMLLQYIIASIRRQHNQPNPAKTKRTQPFQVRLLITGTKEYLDEVLTSASAEGSTGGVPRVPLCEYNSEDLNVFIEKERESVVPKLEEAKYRLEKSRLSHVRLSNPTGTADIGAFRKKLIEGSQNNYSNLQRYLVALDDANERQLEEILWSNSLSKIRIIDSVRNSIADLVKELHRQPQEIDVFNEILPWILLPREGRPTVDQLEAVLCLKYGRKVDVRKRIEQTYEPKSLLGCKDDGVYLFPIALDYFKKEAGVPGALLCQTNNVQKPNSTISYRAQQFDGNEGAPFRDTMPFYSGDLFFEKSGHDEPPNISFQRVDGHCRIILSLLKAVCPAYTTIAESLHGYAIGNMLWHLSQVNQAEIATLGVERRREIGRWLFSFFMNENSVRVWFREKHLWLILSKSWWQDLSEVLKWFQDLEVAKGASAVLGATDSSLLLERKDLLERASEILASEWLLKSSWDAAKAFRWIVRLPKDIVDLDMSGQTYLQVGFDIDDNEGITFEHVRTAERWAQTKLKGNKTKAMRHTRIAETMVHLDIWDEVPSTCKKALDLDDQNWRVKWYLAQSLQRKNDHSGAMHYLLALIKLFEDNPGIKNKYHSAFEDICKRFWDCAQECRNENAIETFLESFAGDKPVTDPYLIAITLGKLEGAKYAKSIETFFRNLLERNSGQGFVELLFKFADDKVFHESISNKLRNIPDILLQAFRRAIQQAHLKAQAADSLWESRLAYLRYYFSIALLYPRLPDTEFCAMVAQGTATDGIAERVRNIDEARHVLQVSVNRWKRQHFPSKDEKMMLGKTTRALGFAYVEWARTDPESNDELSGRELEDRLPRLESLKSQQDERLEEPDLRFPILVARTYRHIGRKTLARKHTRKVFEIAFAILDDSIPENDWNGYDILAQALVSLRRTDDALAAWFLVSQAVEDEDNNRGISDKENSSKGNALGEERSVINDTTDRFTGFDGDDDFDDRSELGYEDDQAITGSASQPARPRSGVFFVCNGKCGHEWQGRIEQDMYLCMDCANVRLELDCLEKLRNGTLARRICGPDHEFLRVEKWTKERSLELGKDKVKVGDKISTVKEWREGIREKYLQ